MKNALLLKERVLSRNAFFRPSAADQLSLREDFDAVCVQVEKNKRKNSVGNDSLSSPVPSRDE